MRPLPGLLPPSLLLPGQLRLRMRSGPLPLHISPGRLRHVMAGATQGGVQRCRAVQRGGSGIQAQVMAAALHMH